MRSEKLRPSFLETPEQDLKIFLGREHDNEEIQFVLDRSCTPHCVEAIAELSGVTIPSFDNLDNYIDFLIQNGANQQTGSSNAEMYATNDGWYNVAVADLLRLNGFDVVLQRLQYAQDVTDLQKAMSTGRVRNDTEVDVLSDLAKFGGEDRSKWMEALDKVSKGGGFTIVSIRIPSSKTPGAWGQHSVVVLEGDDESIEYFDPDKLLLDRYGDDSGNQGIARLDDSKLIYQQSTAQFVSRMTGEIMNIFPPKQGRQGV